MIKKSKEHLVSANETYMQHFKFAIKVSFGMIVSGFLALIHAICPAVFQNSASNKIKELHNLITTR